MSLPGTGPRTGDHGPPSRLAMATLLSTLVLIAVGGFTRGSESGYGCEDRWPLCEGGLAGGWLPRADFHMIVEWSHRWLAGLVGVLVVATATAAWRHRRGNRAVTLPAFAAVAVIGLEAWMGRAVVRAGLARDLVSVHLALSLTVVALLVIVVTAIRVPDENGPVVDARWPTSVSLAAAGLLAVVVLGSAVHDRYFPGWPVPAGSFVPDPTSGFEVLHYLHRLASGLYGVAAVWLWAAARRRGRPILEVNLLGVAAVGYLANLLVGAAHVFTEVDSAGLVALHVGLAAVVWALTVAAAVTAWRAAPVPAESASARSSA